jgi:hypothetical protein
MPINAVSEIPVNAKEGERTKLKATTCSQVHIFFWSVFAGRYCDVNNNNTIDHDHSNINVNVKRRHNRRRPSILSSTVITIVIDIVHRMCC